MKRAWKTGEKRMLVFTGAICLSLFGLGVLYEWNNRVPDLKIPHAAPPSPNAFNFYAQAAKIYKPPVGAASKIDLPIDLVRTSELTLYTKQYFEYYPLARKQQFLQANRKVLQLMRQGGKYPYLQPPERDGKDNVIFSKCRDLARLLLVQSHAQAQAGKWDSSADSLLDILRFSYQLPRGAPLRGTTYANSIRVMGQKDLRLILPHLSAQKARFAARQIESWEASRVLPPQVFEEEKRAVQALILQLIRDRDFRPLYVSYGCIGGCTTITPQQYQRDLDSLQPLLKMRLAWMNKPRLLREYSISMDWYIAQMKLPYPKRAKATPFPDSSDGVDGMIYPQFPVAQKSFALQETSTALLLTMLALHAYKLEHQKYPQKLSALVPEYLKRVPLDPCSDAKELRYQLRPMQYIISRQPQEAAPSRPPQNAPAPSNTSTQYLYGVVPFTLYSVGLDARDDGGVPYIKDLFDDRRRYDVELSWPEETQADIVAGVN